MLWSVDSCQNRVSADQYHLTIPRARVSTHRGRVFFWSYSQTNYQFQMIAGSNIFFPMIHMKYVVFMSLWPCTVMILISNWPRTWKFSQFFKNTGGEDLFLPWSRIGHALRPILMLWLVKIWQVSSCGEFMQHLESCLLWSWRWQSFVLTCDVFLTVFFHWMYKMKYSCYQESSVIHGWFVYWVFGWEMRHLSKFSDLISDGIVFAFHLA